MAKLAVSRIANLKNRHTVKLNIARSDALLLLKEEGYPRLGLALTKAELAIIEQKKLDMYAIIEVYCRLLIERIDVIVDSKECPSDLKEMVASLIFAASRCGGLIPELEKIRQKLTSKYGKDFACSAIEIKNNCGVHPKMVSKSSSLPASMEAKENLLKKIAKDNNIAYHTSLKN
ncbi:IST1-like protein [Salvia hispanica]|uniref:IST1-like protein n=1 Tax=Salvia hispanica TaxID=49212 RepID=UPI0020094C5B|nr:IST1-like protein [Salvia hispanica]